MKTYPISERLQREVPEHWANITYDNVTPSQLAAMIADITARGHGINLNIPLTPETGQGFLRLFDCDRCGACCRGDLEPKARNKAIALTTDELWRLAKMERMSPKGFRKQFCRRYYIDGRKMTGIQYPCRYWSAISGCRIYGKRPDVCRQYPIQETAAITGTGTEVDGVGTLIVDGACPRAAKFAIMMLTGQIMAYRSGLMETLAPQRAKFWEEAREWQRKALEGAER